VVLVTISGRPSDLVASALKAKFEQAFQIETVLGRRYDLMKINDQVSIGECTFGHVLLVFKKVENVMVFKLSIHDFC
jgi:hypothetical protein